MNVVFGIFFGLMFALLLYSMVSVSSAIRKKFQPSIDSAFDALHFFVFGRRKTAKRDHADDGADTK